MPALAPIVDPVALATVKNSIGENIRLIRTRLHLHAGDLAGIAGVSEEHFREIEAGETEPSVTQLVAIAQCMDVAVSVLTTPNAFRGV